MSYYKLFLKIFTPPLSIFYNWFFFFSTKICWHILHFNRDSSFQDDIAGHKRYLLSGKIIFSASVNAQGATKCEVPIQFRASVTIFKIFLQHTVIKLKLVKWFSGHPKICKSINKFKLETLANLIYFLWMQKN